MLTVQKESDTVLARGIVTTMTRPEPHSRPLRVVFLEPSQENAAAEERILRSAGFQFQSTWCHQKDEFKEQVLSGSLDIAVGAFGVPDWTGIEILEWIRSVGLFVPYIVVADSIDAETKVRCLEAGASGVVSDSAWSQLTFAFQKALYEREIASDRQSALADLVRSEEKFSKSFRLSPLPCSIATLSEGKFVDINGAFLKIFGFSREEVIGKSSLELGIWCDPAQRALMLDQLRWGNSVNGLETTMRNRRGERRTVKIFAELIQLGCEKCILAQLEDITETQKLEEQFRQSQKMETIGLLSGGVAHDFNNILGVVLGNVELATERISPGHSALKNLEQIRKAVDDGVGLCRQLLSFSRKQETQAAVLDINAVVRDLLVMLRRVIGENIELLVDLPKRAVHVRADRGLINQAVVNLIVNARDAMPDGGRITIKVRSVEDFRRFEEVANPGQDGTHVMLSIADTGHGMDQQTLGKIFQPFFTTKSEGKGTGLGLVMVRGLVSQSEGQIAVESKPGEGTVFRLFFPLALPPSEQSVPNDQHSNLPEGSETILLIEDNVPLLDATGSILRDVGYSVLEARDSGEALGVLDANKGQIHLVLTDVVLPTTSGFSLFHGKGEMPDGTKVLYVSGYSEEDLDRFGPMGANPPLLLKPFSRATLLKKVRAALDSRKPMDSNARRQSEAMGQ